LARPQGGNSGCESGGVRIETYAYYNVKMQHVVGIDEAGRGPLAGPVAIGIVSIPSKFDKRFFKNIKDSKKLSASNRELWFESALEARKSGLLDFTVVLISEKVIDKKGISYAINLGIKKGLSTLNVSENHRIFLDGGLRVPERFKYQKTVVKGDEKIPVISLASIMAKVTRDRKMVSLSKKFPKFNFDIHKGYGTKAHIRAIKKYGPKSIHRKSFLTRV